MTFALITPWLQALPVLLTFEGLLMQVPNALLSLIIRLM